jgi:hypothetical protein
MKKGNAKLLAMLFMALAVAGGGGGCGGESERFIRKKLEVVCADDLAAAIEDLPDSNVDNSPRYVIESFEHFREGMYTYKAVVDYFFLKGVSVKMVRKYRYHALSRKWDRYFNEYHFVNK